MITNRRTLCHYGTSKANEIPAVDSIKYREIAVNYSHETNGGGGLFIKNDNNEIVDFPSSQKVNEIVSSKTQVYQNLIVDTFQQITEINSIYNFYSDILIEGVTENDYASVIFSATDALSGIFSPTCETLENIVRIFSKSANSITIPTIIIIKN